MSRDKEYTPLAYPFEAILNTEQLAEWLQVSPRHIEGLNLPALANIGGVKRYCAGIVLLYLTGYPDAAEFQGPRRR
jgi:hypothetical protein